MRRTAATLVAILVTVITTCAFAHAAMPLSQIVTGARIAVVADRIAFATVSDPDHAIAAAFHIGDQNVPAGDVVLQAGQPQVNPTYVSVPVAIAVDGKVARTVYVGYRVTTYVVTAVAAHDLTGGAILDAGDIALARLPANGRMAVIPAALIGRKVRMATARGAVMYPEQTTVNELVKPGSSIIFILHDGPVALSADVVARTGGGLGDLVSVYNPQTHTALSGIVTGPNTVELTLPGAN